MRVLHVETINRVAHTYASGLDRLGITSLFFEPSLAGAGRPLPLKLLYMPGRLLHLRHVIGRLRPDYCDVVHIHWASYGIVGLFSKVPVVVHCHGRDVDRRVSHWLGRASLRLSLRNASAVLCISPDLLEPARRIRPDAVLFPASIDTGLFAPSSETPPHPWTVLLFARLDPLKGSPVAVEALERVKRRHPEARILLLDYGILSREYQRRFAGLFEFVPQMPNEAIRQLIWQADVVVGQFFLGALGLSELQAMSCGKPVIAAYRYPTAYPEPPPLRHAETPDEVDAHLEALYRDPGAAGLLGERARAWVCEYHGRDVLARRLATLYGSLAHDTPPRRDPAAAAPTT